MAQSLWQGGGDEWSQTKKPIGEGKGTFSPTGGGSLGGMQSLDPRGESLPPPYGGGSGTDPGAGGGFSSVGSDPGGVRQLPFQKKTTSTPNMGMLDPAMQQRLGQIQQAAPDYASYFSQLSNQAFEDANRQSARLSAAHGGAPTASTGNTGQNQGAYQGMLFDQLNKSNVDRMWNTQDAWETNKYNKGADAYKDYFGAIANRAYDTGEGGFTSGIYNPSGGGGAFNPYANSNFPKYNDSDNPAAGGGGAGGGGAGGGRGGNSRPPGSIGGSDYPGSHPPGGGSWGGGGGANGEWGGQSYDPSNPYLGMGDVNDPNYGQQTGPGWLNGGTGNGYGDGSYDDPYGGGSQGGGLDSYLQEIAQSGAGTNPYQRNGTDYSGWSTRTGYNMANLGRAPVKGEDFYGPGGGMITW